MTGNDDSDITGAEAAVDRVFEQPERIAFAKFFAVHVSTPRRPQPGQCRISRPAPCELPQAPEHSAKTPSCIPLFPGKTSGDRSNTRTSRPAALLYPRAQIL